MHLAALTYGEAKSAIEKGAVGLWPMGSTEAHGPHLPLSTDVLIAEETCRRAAPAIRARFGLEALVLPPLAFTVTEFASPFSGTISIPKATAVAYARDVVASAAKQGFRAVCLVNAHLEPAHRHALRDAVDEARRDAPCPIGIADPCDRRFARTLTEEFKKGACHAGSYETSLILAIDAAIVREELRQGLEERAIDLTAKMRDGAKNFIDAGAEHAYFGDPRAASRPEGEWIYSRLIEMVEIVLDEMLAGARPAEARGEKP